MIHLALQVVAFLFLALVAIIGAVTLIVVLLLIFGVPTSASWNLSLVDVGHAHEGAATKGPTGQDRSSPNR